MYWLVKMSSHNLFIEKISPYTSTFISISIYLQASNKKFTCSKRYSFEVYKFITMVQSTFPSLSYIKLNFSLNPISHKIHVYWC